MKCRKLVIVGLGVIGGALAVVARGAPTGDHAAWTLGVEGVPLPGSALPLVGAVAPVVPRRRRRQTQGPSARVTRQHTAREKELFRRLVRRTSDVVALVGSAGIVQAVAGPVRRVVGVPGPQLIGTALTDHVHPEDASAVKAMLAPYARLPKADHLIEFRVRVASRSA